MGVKLTNCWKWRSSPSRPTKPTKRTLVRLSLTWNEAFLMMLFQQVGLGGYLCTLHFYTLFRNSEKTAWKKKTISKFSSSSSPVCSCLSEVSQPPEKLEFFQLRLKSSGVPFDLLHLRGIHVLSSLHGIHMQLPLTLTFSLSTRLAPTMEFWEGNAACCQCHIWYCLCYMLYLE